MRTWLSFHDLQVPGVVLLLAPVGQLLPAVGRVGPDHLEPWHEKPQSAQELARANRVMHIGRGDVARDGRAQRIDQQMSFASLHTCVRVVAANVGRLLDGLHTLAVHDGGTWVGVATDALTLCSMQRGTEQMPETLEAEAPELVEHRLPRREVGREVAPRHPGTAGAQHVEDGVEDATQRMRARPAAL